MARRLLLARREVTRCREYDYLVVNDRLEEAVRNIGAIIRSERCRTRRQNHRAAAILRAFRAAPSASRTRN
jgi:guanylate kinase